MSKMKYQPTLRTVGTLLVGLFLISCIQTEQQSQSEPHHYEASWESLTQHEVPQWLRDAKFGIYAHWGVYSVPAYGNEWYGKLMYDPSNRRNIYQHHQEVYGGPDQFGYRQFIPKFKAEKYDPVEWADLIKRSGAKYAGIAVVHHDGFAMWDSDVNQWNAGKMGPKRDLYGDLVQALREQNLKVIATFHHLRTFNWFVPDSLPPGAKEKWDIFDPKYSHFYWNDETSTLKEFMQVWKARVKEVIDKYQPDVLWFDGGKFRSMGRAQDVESILAYYYNQGQKWGRPVEVLNKLPTSMQFNFPIDFGMLTFEGGRDRPKRVDYPWVDDLKIGLSSWGYVQGLQYRNVDRIIDALVDRVSRNGGMLLSLSPKADGQIPQEQQDILLAMGKWFDTNGEAIYGTHAWKTRAEGGLDHIRMTGGAHVHWTFENTTAADIRFTQKGDTLYAIALDWPEGNQLTIESLNSLNKIGEKGITDIVLLGSDAELSWERDVRGLHIQLPQTPPGDYAYAFRILYD